MVLERPGIEVATPGLQGIALIHYTTAASGAHSKFFPGQPEGFIVFVCFGSNLRPLVYKA